MWLHIVIFQIIIAVILQVQGAKLPPLNVISTQGLCKSVPVISKYFRASFTRTTLDGNMESDQSIQVLNVLDCTGADSDADCKFVNDLFDTEFSNSINGLVAQVSSEFNAIVLRSCFDHMYSNDFCGAKATDFALSLKCPTIVIMENSGSTYQSIIDNEQLMRRLLSRMNMNADSSVMIIMKTSESLSAVQEQVQSAIKVLADDMDFALADLIPRMKIVVANPIDQDCMRSTRSLIESSKYRPKSIDDVSSWIVASWSNVPISPRPIFSKRQQMHLYEIETSYLKVIHQVELAMAQMQSRISGGKLLAKFPDRIKTLLSTSLLDFNSRIGSSASMIRERTEKAKLIRDSVLGSASRLFDQQMFLVELQQLQKLKKQLEKLYQSTDEVSKGDLQALARRALFEFKTAASELEESSIGLKVPDAKLTDYSSKVDLITKEFVDSPDAKLIELKKLEKKTRNENSKKKSGGIGQMFGVGLSIVGMLRPHGYGNLQGFLSYATSIIGLPIDFLLGVQNDGDSLEVAGEDREHPFLRLQPKLNFMVDV